MQSNTKVWDEAAKACTPSVRVDFVMESTLRACGPGLLNNGFYCCPETCSRLSVGLKIELWGGAAGPARPRSGLGTFSG